MKIGKQMKFKCIECGHNEFVLKSRTSNDYETDDLTDLSRARKRCRLVRRR